MQQGFFGGNLMLEALAIAAMPAFSIFMFFAV
jgi:hypothetical protein